MLGSVSIVCWQGGTDEENNQGGETLLGPLLFGSGGWFL